MKNNDFHNEPKSKNLQSKDLLNNNLILSNPFQNNDESESFIESVDS